VYKAEKVYVLMGFFEHRIQPTWSEDNLRALVRPPSCRHDCECCHVGYLPDIEGDEGELDDGWDQIVME
jgi:hypothetical protein